MVISWINLVWQIKFHLLTDTSRWLCKIKNIIQMKSWTLHFPAILHFLKWGFVFVLFIHLFIYSFIHSFIHSFIYSFIHLFIYFFICLFIYLFIYLIIYLLFLSKGSVSYRKPSSVYPFQGSIGLNLMS